MQAIVYVVHAITCFLRQDDPVAGIAEPLDEAPEDCVLLLRPRSPLHPRLVAARRPPHRLASFGALTAGPFLASWLRAVQLIPSPAPGGRHKLFMVVDI